MKKIIFCMGIFLILSNCTGFVVKKKVIANYYLIATDAPEDMGLGYHAPDTGDNYDEIIPCTVFAIGYNNKYIIVKQHPRTFPNPTDTTITNYYIVPIKARLTNSIKEIVIGPLTFDEFYEKLIELNISNAVSFTNVSEL